MPTTSPLPTSPAQVDAQTGAITVPMLLQQPTRVTRQVAAVATANYWADRILPNGGGVSGGGVIFDVVQPGDNFANRTPEEIAPGGEFPINNATEPVPGSAKVAKWGTKIKVTDEKRDRNDIRYVQREQVRAANSMVRLLHQKAVATIEAAVTAYSRTASFNTAFGSVVNLGTSQTPYIDRPAAEIQNAQAVADSSDHNVTFDTLLVNTLDYAKLQSVYPASEGGVDQGMWPDGGGTVIPTNLITQGTTYLIASNEAGETRWEKPLYTTVFREEKIESDWIQIGARAVYFVDNPYAILKITGA